MRHGRLPAECPFATPALILTAAMLRRAASIARAVLPGRAANDIGRVDVSEPASISSGIAERYATAVFGLAKDDKKLPALEADVDALEAALNDSADLRAMVTSPIYTRAEQGEAIHALSTRMGLDPVVTNTLRLMAEKRRLFVLPQLVRSLRERIAEEKGEVTAEVTSAVELTKTQLSRLAKTLKEKVGKDVNIKTTVDESLIGGLIVKVGSKMIDTSVKAKLANLQNAMKEVG
jgi:F-type H+-transporting ATPase subunit delta